MSKNTNKLKTRAGRPTTPDCITIASTSHRPVPCDHPEFSTGCRAHIVSFRGTDKSPKDHYHLFTVARGEPEARGSLFAAVQQEKIRGWIGAIRVVRKDDTTGSPSEQTAERKKSFRGAR